MEFLFYQLKRISYGDLVERVKYNLDIFWLKDEILDYIDSLSPTDLITTKIVENLEAALEQFRSVAEELS